jgi:hypothetical protein
MADVLITEHAGTRQGPVIRLYQYGSGGVRVLDSAKTLRRLYLFEPSSGTMTERDPARQEKVLRRFIIDRYGMLEETFGFGERPRTFRYEDGASRIAVREGGDYGAVGKTFTFEGKGVVETAWGRHGEIERVYSFDPANGTITLRKAGWFGDVERTLVPEGIDASLFREPEAFLQFLMFTEWSTKDQEEETRARVAEIRAGKAATGGSPYAYTGPRSGSPGAGESTGRAAPRQGAPLRRDNQAIRAQRSGPADSGIDFIPDADAPGQTSPQGRGPPSRRSEGVPFEERWQRRDDAGTPFSRGKSAEIPLDERFESARREREELSKGRSAEIPLDERFESARSEREELSRGRSAEIPLDERFEKARGEQEPLSRGRSVEIPIEERFEGARREREKLSRGRSAGIPYDERRGGDR